MAICAHQWLVVTYLGTPSSMSPLRQGGGNVQRVTSKYAMQKTEKNAKKTKLQVICKFLFGASGGCTLFLLERTAGEKNFTSSGGIFFRFATTFLLSNMVDVLEIFFFHIFISLDQFHIGA